MPVRSILVAVDFGDAAARAVATAGAIAERCPGAALRLLHAESIEAPAYFTSEQIDDLERQRRAIAAQAEHFLSRFGRQHTAIPFAAAVEHRSPVEAIIAAARSADLVVMGTHGRRGPKRWWLGSVAERVLREIQKPLLIVRAVPAGDPSPSAPDRIFDRAVVHAAAPLRGDTALAFARELTSCTGGTVIDERAARIEPGAERAHATLVVAAMPEPRTAAWTTHDGEPLVRACTAPILFVPEVTEGATR